MLYKTYHLDQIRTHSKTATRREWDTPQVRVGGVYIASDEMFTSHEEADCYIQVADLYEQPLGEMTDEDARHEGDYENVEEFREGYERVYGEGSWDPEKVVWVVEFDYVGEEKPDQVTRIAGCPNCAPGDFDAAHDTVEALFIGEAGAEEAICDYHLNEINEGTREYMEEKVDV